MTRDDVIFIHVIGTWFYLAGVEHGGAARAELNAGGRLGLHIQLQHPKVIALGRNKLAMMKINRQRPASSSRIPVENSTPVPVLDL
jgi:hypothetical protein